MSDQAVLQEVSKALRVLLVNEFNTVPALSEFVRDEQDIVFSDPSTALQGNADHGVSLWLYQVSVDEFRRNDPPVRTPPGSSNVLPSSEFPPLPLTLAYLVTPLGKKQPEMCLHAHGVILRTFYKNAITVVANGTVLEELKIVLAPLTLGELSAIWEALREPYQLSVAYQVRIARLDANMPVPGSPVVERTAAWAARS